MHYIQGKEILTSCGKHSKGCVIISQNSCANMGQLAKGSVTGEMENDSNVNSWWKIVKYKVWGTSVHQIYNVF